jgi:zinc transport system ATP-binding protein
MTETVRLVLAEAHGVTVRFGERVVLNDVHLRVHAGEIVTLIGPNGAGKSTLVRVMLGLQKPDAGQVSLRPGLRVGYVPQRLSVDPVLPLTVRRFLTLAARHPEQRLIEALREVGVAGRLDNPLQSLSGGELQRVLLARALLRDPQLLFLDEPVQGVDVSGQTELYALIGRLRDERGVGVLMVSHDLHLVMERTDVVFCLDQQVCCVGHPDQVKNQPAFQMLFRDARGLVPYTHHHDGKVHHTWCQNCPQQQGHDHE